ncbi:amidohydrolase [Gigaspora margarita]|uniref:Peptidase M20 domain-containing protein 2 n=1 Tax=Gigaspora margarita TaxID=4874 RepID=A0A8H3X884_GIGMA|nr:amidohydrolase [Gigaspora margarita]
MIFLQHSTTLHCTSSVCFVGSKTLKAIDDVSDDISIKIHENPELAYEERYAHNLLVKYLQEKGFKVTPHAFGLETAFVAEFQSKVGKGRVISFNSEYDALPEIGHACGHNLIAISGVGAAIGLKTVLEKFNIKGTVKLFGTPAEEKPSGKGKVKLVDAGAYNGVDVSLMVHPGPINGGFIPFLAVQTVFVEYFGKASHASVSPFDGINALDAIGLAYNNIGLLRQQILPTDRIHGIITNGGKSPNVIPEYTSGTFYIRGITMKDLKALQPRVNKCFEAAAEATGTTAKIKWEKEVYDVKINEPLASRYEYYLSKKFGRNFPPKVIQSAFSSGSTDQGNVTYVVPGFHPVYDICASTPVSNHQREFTTECKSKNAHEETIKATSGMALVGLDFLLDDEFAMQVKNSFIKSKL